LAIFASLARNLCRDWSRIAAARRPRSDERGYGKKREVLLGFVIFVFFCGEDFLLRLTALP
jgi:hypothetical protein